MKNKNKNKNKKRRKSSFWGVEQIQPNFAESSEKTLKSSILETEDGDDDSSQGNIRAVSLTSLDDSSLTFDVQEAVDSLRRNVSSTGEEESSNDFVEFDTELQEGEEESSNDFVEFDTELQEDEEESSNDFVEFDTELEEDEEESSNDFVEFDTKIEEDVDSNYSEPINVYSNSSDYEKNKNNGQNDSLNEKLSNTTTDMVKFGVFEEVQDNQPKKPEEVYLDIANRYNHEKPEQPILLKFRDEFEFFLEEYPLNNRFRECVDNPLDVERQDFKVVSRQILEELTDIEGNVSIGYEALDFEDFVSTLKAYNVYVNTYEDVVKINSESDLDFEELMDEEDIKNNSHKVVFKTYKYTFLTAYSELKKLCHFNGTSEKKLYLKTLRKSYYKNKYVSPIKSKMDKVLNVIKLPLLVNLFKKNKDKSKSGKDFETNTEENIEDKSIKGIFSKIKNKFSKFRTQKIEKISDSPEIEDKIEGSEDNEKIEGSEDEEKIENPENLDLEKKNWVKFNKIKKASEHLFKEGLVVASGAAFSCVVDYLTQGNLQNVMPAISHILMSSGIIANVGFNYMDKISNNLKSENLNNLNSKILDNKEFLIDLSKKVALFGAGMKLYTLVSPEFNVDNEIDNSLEDENSNADLSDVDQTDSNLEGDQTDSNLEGNSDDSLFDENANSSGFTQDPTIDNTIYVSTDGEASIRLGDSIGEIEITDGAESAYDAMSGNNVSLNTDIMSDGNTYINDVVILDENGAILDRIFSCDSDISALVEEYDVSENQIVLNLVDSKSGVARAWVSYSNLKDFLVSGFSRVR